MHRTKSISVILILVFLMFSYSVLVPFAGADELFFADSLGVDNATGYKNTFVIVPVNITNTHDNISAIEFTIQYDKNVIEFIDAYKGKLTSGWNVIISSPSTIGIFGLINQSIPVNSSGSVALLNFSVLGEPGTMTWLNITNITLGNLTLLGTATPKNGTFTVAGAQAWYLHQNGVMYRGNLSIPVDTVSISPGNNITWVANEPALVDAAFRAGRWTGWLILNEPFPEGDNFTAEIGSYNCSDNNFSAAGSQNFTGAAGTDKTMFEVNIQASAFMVPEGDYLAFRISNPTNNSNGIVVQTGKSFVTSPESDPGYPVPELHTVMLFFFGLLTLIAYYMLWNRSSRGHK